jgi:leucyl aminopeptidase
MPKIRLVSGAPERVRCDLLAVGVYKGPSAGPGAEAVARKLGVPLKQLFATERVKGDVGEAIIVPTYGKLPASRVAFVGLGEKSKAGTLQVRRAGAVLAKRAGGAKVVATTLAQGIKGSKADAARAFTEGFLLGAYRFDRYKTSPNGKAPGTAEVLIAAEKTPAHVLTRAQVVADATNIARDLTNIPAGDLAPAGLANEARKLARGTSMRVRVLDERQLKAKGFGGILGVGRGSAQPPRLIEMRYSARGARKTVALVGKGITFDSGGINLKNQSLDWMKMDMAGGAAVLATMWAIAKLKPKVNVIGLVCSAENMPGGNALHPGDILRMYGGKTVEVADTDAEGRLVLADGIVYAKEQGATTIVDIATLTGAIMIALGNRSFGVLSNDDKVARSILDAADRAGEYAWQLPIYDEYRKGLDSDVADMKNLGGRWGGAINAALFLREFVGDTPWAHLDIAGAAKSDNDEYEIPKGGTGAGVRTLLEWLTSL